MRTPTPPLPESLATQWAEFLADELSNSEQEQLYAQVMRRPELAQTLLADAEMHGLLVATTSSAAVEDALVESIMSRTTSAVAGEPSAEPSASAEPNLRVVTVARETAQETPRQRQQPFSLSRGFITRHARMAAAIAGAAAAIVCAMLALSTARSGNEDRPSAPEDSIADSGAPNPGSSTLPTHESQDDTQAHNAIAQQSPDKDPGMAQPEPYVDPFSHGADGTTPNPSPGQLVERPPTQPSESNSVPRTPLDSAERNLPVPVRTPVWMVSDETVQGYEPPVWESSLPTGRPMIGRTLRLLKGAATLLIEDVGELTVHGPAEIRPESDQLFMKYGEIMANTRSPLSVTTPAAKLQIISRASVTSDNYGTTIRATAPVDILSTAKTTRPETVTSGGYKWVSSKGEVHEWMVALLETQGVVVLAVNNELCPVSLQTARSPGASVAQMIRRSLAGPNAGSISAIKKDAKGALMVNGEVESFFGVRGIVNAGKRVNVQIDERRRATLSNGVEMTINGLQIPDLPVPRASQIRPPAVIGASPDAARQLANELFDNQRRMLDSMGRNFGVNLSGAKQAVEQARQRALNPGAKK